MNCFLLFRGSTRERCARHHLRMFCRRWRGSTLTPNRNPALTRRARGASAAGRLVRSWFGDFVPPLELFRLRKAPQAWSSLFRPKVAQAGVLRVWLIGLDDCACNVGPGHDPRHDEGKEKSSGHRAQRLCLQKILPVEPQGKIEFQQQHAYQWNRGFGEKRKGCYFGDAPGQMPEKTSSPDAGNAVR